ncbi:uncharacterized protein MONBRDRAFT_29704 [Monosiga brevicollis MX1]|uniref:non-specific protein-tyrosine kinase n=1 Tax=Monosiga brevicollis TaxID=81824 RepID=A9VBW1_MONBE|nr:uncharacterized protein MONBRDRAFT_29704 [Monosiga brevicollis MX1]EDQ85046.1 predicted protein [Monosiga brevicollis MX1]|eukprot:XP_001750216.1 hypothetical protein [Monosiga brevicollis MX1]
MRWSTGLLFLIACAWMAGCQASNDADPLAYSYLEDPESISGTCDDESNLYFCFDQNTVYTTSCDASSLSQATRASSNFMCTGGAIDYSPGDTPFPGCTGDRECSAGLYCSDTCQLGLCGYGVPEGTTPDTASGVSGYCQPCALLPFDDRFANCHLNPVSPLFAGSIESATGRPVDVVFTPVENDGETGVNLTNPARLHQAVDTDELVSPQRNDVLYIDSLSEVYQGSTYINSYAVQVDQAFNTRALYIGLGVSLTLNNPLYIWPADTQRLCVAGEMVGYTDEQGQASCFRNCPDRCLSCAMSENSDFAPFYFAARGRGIASSTIAPVTAPVSNKQGCFAKCADINAAPGTAHGCFGFQFDTSTLSCRIFTSYAPDLDTEATNVADTTEVYLRQGCRTCNPGTVWNKYANACEYNSVPPTPIHVSDANDEAYITEEYLVSTATTTAERILFTNYVQVRDPDVAVFSVYPQGQVGSPSPLTILTSPVADAVGIVRIDVLLPAKSTTERATAVTTYLPGSNYALVLAVDDGFASCVVDGSPLVGGCTTQIDLLLFVPSLDCPASALEYSNPREAVEFAFPDTDGDGIADTVTVQGLDDDVDAALDAEYTDDAFFGVSTGVVSLEPRQEPYTFAYMWTHAALRGELRCERSFTVLQGFSMGSSVIDHLERARAQYDIFLAPATLSSITPDLPEFNATLIQNSTLNFGVVNDLNTDIGNIPFSLEVSPNNTEITVTWQLEWCTESAAANPTYIDAGITTLTLNLIDGVMNVGNGTLWSTADGACIHSAGELPIQLPDDIFDDGVTLYSVGVTAINFFIQSSVDLLDDGATTYKAGADNRLIFVFNDPTFASRMTNVDSTAPRIIDCPQTSEILQYIRETFNLESNQDATLPLGTDSVFVTWEVPIAVDNVDLDTEAIPDENQPEPNSTLTVYGSPYFVRYTATDASGNEAEAACVFEIPIDQFDSPQTTVALEQQVLHTTNLPVSLSSGLLDLKTKTFTLLDTPIDPLTASVNQMTNLLTLTALKSALIHGIHIRSREDAYKMQFYVELAIDEYANKRVYLDDAQDEGNRYLRDTDIPAVVEIMFSGIQEPTNGDEAPYLEDRWYKLESAVVSYNAIDNTEVFSGYSPSFDVDFVFSSVSLRVRYPKTREVTLATIDAHFKLEFIYTLHADDNDNAELLEIVDFDPNPPVISSTDLASGEAILVTDPEKPYATFTYHITTTTNDKTTILLNGKRVEVVDASALSNIVISPENGTELEIDDDGHTITVTATDDDLNFATASYIFNVVDIEPPRFVPGCPRSVSKVVPATATNGEAEFAENEVSPLESEIFDNDEVEDVTVLYYSQSYSYLESGANVTTIAMDDHDNQATCVVFIYVTDETPPQITCPTATISQLTTDASVTVDLEREVTVSDNSGESIELVFNVTSFEFAADTETWVQVSGTDSSGNAATPCVLVVLVEGVAGAGANAAQSAASGTSSVIVGAASGAGALIIILAIIVLYAMRSRANQAADFHALKARLEQDSNMQLSKEPRELNREWLIVLSELGQGAFGIVYEASLSEPKAPEIQVAAKSLRKDALDNEREELLEEALVMAQMEHANVVGLIGVITKGRPIYVVLEHMRNGSLKDYVKNKTCTPAQQVAWSRQVASGMAHIHSLGFIHRDLAARNVLLSASLTAKVADFGLARESTDDAYYRSRGGNVPVRWTAPESLNQNLFSEKSDVWAFGVLMYEVYTKAAMPYTGWNNQRVWIEVTNGYRLECPPDCPSDVYKVMYACWALTREDRPTFSELEQRLGEIDVAEEGGAGAASAASPAASATKTAVANSYVDVRFDKNQEKGGSSNPANDYLEVQNSAEMPNQYEDVLDGASSTRVATSSDVGARVTVTGYGTGMLRFYGPHHVKRHLRCGVHLDQPLGNNNGVVGGHTYFNCPDKHGVLVVPSKVFVLLTEEGDNAYEYSMSVSTNGRPSLAPPAPADGVYEEPVPVNGVAYDVPGQGQQVVQGSRTAGTSAYELVDQDPKNMYEQPVPISAQASPKLNQSEYEYSAGSNLNVSDNAYEYSSAPNLNATTETEYEYSEAPSTLHKRPSEVFEGFSHTAL